MLKAILVDDEIAAIRSLELLLKQCCPDVQIIGTARSGKEALQLLSHVTPDIVFLDIEMPHGSGFELLESIPNLNFEIIFITAYNQYAVKAFKYSAVDYILKPVDIDELVKAVDKVRRIKSSHTNSRARYNALFENLKGLVPVKLVIPQGDTFQTINLKDVVVVNLKCNSASFLFMDGTLVSCSSCSNDLSSMLSERGFLNVATECFINLGKVKMIEKSGKGSVIMENGKSIDIELISKEDLINQLARYSTLQ